MRRKGIRSTSGAFERSVERAEARHAATVRWLNDTSNQAYNERMMLDLMRDQTNAWPMLYGGEIWNSPIAQHQARSSDAMQRSMETAYVQRQAVVAAVRSPWFWGVVVLLTLVLLAR